MEEAHWLRYLIPLPQEITVEDSICLCPGDVSVQLRDGAGEENTGAIRTWRGALGPEPWHYRVHDAIKATEETVWEIARFVCERYFY